MFSLGTRHPKCFTVCTDPGTALATSREYFLQRRFQEDRWDLDAALEKFGFKGSGWNGFVLRKGSLKSNFIGSLLFEGIPFLGLISSVREQHDRIRIAVLSRINPRNGVTEVFYFEIQRASNDDYFFASEDVKKSLDGLPGYFQERGLLLSAVSDVEVGAQDREHPLSTVSLARLRNTMRLSF